MRNLFTLFDGMSDKELLKEDNTLAKLEIISRTNTLSDLECLDINSTEQAAYLLSVLQRCGVLNEEIKKYDALLFPLFTQFRDVTVFTHHYCYKWLLDNLKQPTNTEFDMLLAQLSKLRSGTIKDTSRVYKILVDYGFSDSEIYYLNYLLCEANKTSTLKAKLIVNCINAFGRKPTELLEVEKEIIISLLQQLNHCSMGTVRELLQDTEEITLDANWEWFYKFERKYFDYTCKMIRVYPNIYAYKERYKKLSEEDKYRMLTYCLVTFSNKEDLFAFLKDIDKEDYIEKYALEDEVAIEHLMNLKAINITDLPEKYLMPYVKCLPSSDAFLWLLNNFEDVEQPLQYITSYYYYGFFHPSDCVNWDSFNDVSDDDFKNLLLRLLDLVLLESNYSYCSMIEYLLKYDRFKSFFTKEELRLICEYLYEISYTNVCSDTFIEIEKALYSEEEYDNLIKEREQLKATQKKEREAEEQLELDNYFKKYFRNLKDAEDLASRYEEYGFSNSFSIDEREYVRLYIKKRLSTFLKKGVTYSEELVDLLSELYEYEIYTFQEYVYALNQVKEESVNE